MALKDLAGHPKSFIPALMKPTQFGSPYHGFLKNGELYDQPGGTLIKSAVSQDASGSVYSATQLVKVPGITAVTRTTEEQAIDTANNFNWKNYALVAGTKLHGQDLPDNWIIYIDGNGVPWLLDYEIYAYNGWHVRVTLRSLFGRFSVEPYPAINREVADYADQLIYGYQPGAVYNGPCCTERNSNGSVVLAHMYTYSWDSQSYIYKSGTRGKLVAVFKITISGNGSTGRETLGDGISASVITYKSEQDCNSSQANVVVGQHRDDNIDWTTYDTYSPRLIVSNETIQSPSASPPCTDDIDETTYATGPGDEVYSDILATKYTHLLRIVFDGDTEILYTVDRWSKTYWVSSASVSGENVIRDTITYVEVSPGVCGQDQDIYPTETTYSGVINLGYVVGYETRSEMALKRNGATVSSVSFTGFDWDSTSITKPGGEVATQIYTSGVSYSLNGDAYPDSDIELVIHFYSPQVAGIHAIRSDGTFSKIFTVATPYGSDNAHDGVELTHNGLACVGSHDPVDHKTVWYEAGVTDVTGAKINFI